jgi:hypothetical protein
VFEHRKNQGMIELNIKWDGVVPGLREHRLSVNAFSNPLHDLLMIIRRTANNMLREATARKETGVGRFSAEAQQIDMHLTSIGEGSADLHSIIEVEAPGAQIEMWPEGLAADAVDRVLQDIENEGNGIQRNTRVRDYLKGLPPGLSNQDYVLVVDGITRRTVHLTTVVIATDLDALPYLVEIDGRVIGVGFEPGRNFVRVKSDEEAEITFSATAEQVTAALEIRAEDIRVLAVVQGGIKRLLRIQRRWERHVKLDSKRFIFEKWDGLLARLAQ